MRFSKTVHQQKISFNRATPGKAARMPGPGKAPRMSKGKPPIMFKNNKLQPRPVDPRPGAAGAGNGFRSTGFPESRETRGHRGRRPAETPRDGVPSAGSVDGQASSVA